MPYQLSLNAYVGGEVRWTSSPYSLAGSTDERTTEVVRSEPEKTQPPLLDYSAQLETASRVRLSGFGELALRKTKFTKAASRAVQRWGRAMDDYSDRPQEILFFTGTLPGSGPEQFEAMAKWSSWIVHRLKAWIAKRVEAKHDFYVWELQKRGALHLHYALHVPDQAARFEIRTQIKNEWIKLLQQVSEFTGIDVFRNTHRGFSHVDNLDMVQADCQEVEKSVAGYLGKYLSKGSQGKSSTAVFHPCRWYGGSRPLRQYEESLRRKLTITFGAAGEWLSSIDVLKNIMSLVSDHSFFWDNKIVSGEGGVSYDVNQGTLEEMLQIHYGERMSYASINAKLRDKWRDLICYLQQIEQRNPKWIQTMCRKHCALSDWQNLQLLGGSALTSPDGLRRAHHLVWAFQDLLHDPWNTWKPSLSRENQSRLTLLLKEMEDVLLLNYEFDLTEDRKNDVLY